MTRSDSLNEIFPVLFIGHGSPMNALQENEYTGALKKLGNSLKKPRAILMVSAHWETEGTWVTGMSRPKTIHDFFGFPDELYNVSYPAPGSPRIANEVVSSISEIDIQVDDQSWGLDHGSWSVLKHVFPKADVPIIQMSVDKTKPMEFHFNLGKNLRFLRERGVLIIGSGNIVHNLRFIDWKSDARPYDWAIEFDEWVNERLSTSDFQALIRNPLKLESGRLSIPTVEHYLPLLYILGASYDSDKLEFIYEGFQNSSISMRSLSFSTN